MNPQEIIQQNKDVYNRIAKEFFHTRQIVWDDLLPLARFAKAGDKILDLGCGFGRLSELFKDLSVDYVGVDQSEKQIEIAKKTFPNLKFIVAEMQALPLKDEEFDIVYCIATFHHLPDETTRVVALREMKRVLRSGGKIVMTNWNLGSDWAKEKYHSDNGKDFMVPWKDAAGQVIGERYYYNFEKQELKNLCREAGLTVIEQYYTKRGEESTVQTGENLVTIISK